MLAYQREKRKSSGMRNSNSFTFYNLSDLFLHFLLLRPFARRLPEFKFWYSCSRAIIIATFMTFFELFDVPVFWPILLLYFIVLFVITMKRQIRHMMKYKYVPFSWGKAKYVTAGSKSAGEKK